MAQSDQVVQNATFPSVRADINDNLAALYSQSSGNTAPTVTVAFQPWVDTSSNPPVKKIRNGSNTAWITEGILDPAGFNPSGIPTGQVILVALSSAPTGYLKANGAAVSRSTYATLFAAIGTTFGVGDGSTTFNLPDLRGEFMRGWDDGRGVDSGRSFGSAQGFAMQEVTGQITTSADGNAGYFTGSSGAFTLSGCGTKIVAGGGAFSGSYCRFFNFSLAAGGAQTATETRPRNISLLTCIKF